MDIFIFLLIMSICLGLVYVVHKYYKKEQFYLLALVYSVISFLMSFKIVNVFGVDINANIIFSSGLIMILYYFVNRYDIKESRKLIYTILGCSFVCNILFLMSGFIVPSIYDKMSVLYQSLVFDNLVIFILYPISLAITLFLSEYCFREIKKEDRNIILKIILIIFGITFIDIALFIYFSYAFILKYDTSVMIAINTYLIKVCIMIIHILIVNKLFTVKKVK